MKKLLYLIVVVVCFISCRSVEREVYHEIVIDHIEDIKNHTHEIYIPKGGNLSSEMLKIGLTPQQIAELTMLFGNNVDFRAVQPNDHFQVVIDPDTKTVLEFNYLPNFVTAHKIVLNQETNSYEYIYEQKELMTKLTIIEGVVYTTLIQAMTDNNVDENVKYLAANALSSRVNFSAYTNAGDTFKVMYEEYFYETQKIPGARLIYTSYNGRKTGFHEGFRYTEPDVASAFNGMYTTQGQSMLVANFRWPLDRIHVTSPYGYRYHPVYKNRQMHYGVDYRGATGTPIYSVASGRVIMAGRHGGFGNTVEIQHENNYITQYAHLNRIHVRNGQRVNKGTIIGTVGSTGVSTGPHLHFGLRVGGKWSNPANLRMAAATKLEGRRLETFRKQIIEIKALLDQVENEVISPFEMTVNERHRRTYARRV